MATKCTTSNIFVQYAHTRQLTAAMHELVCLQKTRVLSKRVKFFVFYILISLSVLSSYAADLPRALFDAWASGSGLTGDTALPTAQPFGDGTKNILKYAFNMQGSAPDVRRMEPGGTAGLPLFSVIGSGAGTKFRVEFVRRRDSGLTYLPKSSSSLDIATFQEMSGISTMTTIDANWERVIVEQALDPAANPARFGILMVTLPDGQSAATGVSGSGMGITDPAAFRAALGLGTSALVSERGALPLTSQALLLDRSRNDKSYRLTQIITGDSYGVSLKDSLDAQIAVNRGRGMSPNDCIVANIPNGPTPTSSGFKSSDFTRSITGNICHLGPSNTLIAPNVSTIYFKRFHLFYIKEKGAGSFKVESSTSGGPWTELPANSALPEIAYPNRYAIAPATGANPIQTDQDGAIDCGIFSYDFGNSLQRQIRVTGLANTTKILGVAWTDIIDGTVGKGGTEVFDLSASGQTVQNMSSAPQVVFNTILRTLRPHFATFKADDNESQMAYLETFINKCAIAWPTLEWVIVSSHPRANDTGNVLTAPDLVERAIAERIGATFIDMRAALPSYEAMQANNMTTDNYHLSYTGNRYQEDIIMDRLRASLKPAYWIGGETNSTQSNILRGPRWYSPSLGVADYFTPSLNKAFFEVADFHNSGPVPNNVLSLWKQTDGNIMTQIGLYGRWQIEKDSGSLLIAGGTDGMGYPQNGPPGRTASGQVEIHTGNSSTTVGLVLSGRQGQTADLLQIRTNSNVTAGSAGAVAAKITGDGRAEFKTLKSSNFTVATLPAASAGTEAYVSDSSSTHSAGVGKVVVGGGSNFVPVYHDGVNWRIR